MKKWILALLLFVAMPGWAQVYTVTGQATDSDGQQWIGGSYQIKLINPNGMIPPNYSCSTTGKSFPANFLGTLDSSGQFSVQLTSTACIVPKGLLWQFTICPNVTGAACGTIQIPITQAGSITGQIAPSLLAPRVTGGPGIHAYNDTEVAAFSPNTYFNVISQSNRCYSTSWGVCTGAGTIPSATAAGQGPKSTGPGQNSYIAYDLYAPVLNASAADVIGVNIGAKANTLFNQLVSAGQLGTVTIDPTAAADSMYVLGTGIVIPLGDTLDCQGAWLLWSGTTLASAITYTGPSQTTSPGGMQNCHLLGAGGVVGNGSYGFYAGGDANNVLTPATNYGNFFFIRNSSIQGFGAGYSHGNNTWANVMDGDYFDSNYDHVFSTTSTTTNNGEATKITNTNFYNAGHCGFNLNWAGDAYYMIGGHLDFNTAGGVCGTWADIQLQNVWEESYFGPGINIISGSAQDYISVTGGHFVLDASPLTITNVAIDGSNHLTITATGGLPSGYWVGHPLTFFGLTTATFLNGTQGTIQTVNTNAGVTTVVLGYTHSTYASAPDTGTVQQYTPDMYHMEGGPGSYFLTTGVHEIVNPQILTQGALPAVIGLGSTTQSDVCVKDMIGPQYAIVGSYQVGCLYDSTVQGRGGTGATLFTVAAGGVTVQTGTQGWTRDWNYFNNGELDDFNVRGLGIGGYYLCDLPFSGTPTIGACQMHLDASGNVTFLGTVTATNITGTPVTSVFTRTGAVTATSGDYTVSQVTGAAPIASPTFTGVPAVPTASPGTNTTQAASTAFVAAAIPTVPVSSVFTRTGAVVATSGDYTISQITGGAPLASPAFTGTPTAPTQAISTNNTDIATTAAVTSALASYAALASANTFSLSQTAASFIPQSKAAGPNSVFFDDFFSTGNLVLAAIGSQVGAACSTVNALDTNHPGIIEAVSGTGASGTGVACILGASRVLVTPYLTSWTYETAVQPSVLPGTTSGSYQLGLSGTLAGDAWTSSIGFNLSHANANANHWYCQDGGTYVDTGVVATLAWSRMTIVNNGTNIIWYIGGSQVCSETSSGAPTSNMFLEWTSTTLTASTNVVLYVDYVNFNESVTR